MEPYDGFLDAARPRTLVIGSLRDPLGFTDDGLLESLRHVTDLRHVPGAAPIRQSLRVLMSALGLIDRERYEMVHLLDARFAVVGMMLQRQCGVPVSATVTSVDATPRSPLGALSLRALNHLDQAFVSEDAVSMLLRERAPRLPLTAVRPGARALPWPSKGAISSVTRALRSVRPGRLVIALPWPGNRNDLRWFRDVVLPQIDANPVCLLIGAPSRREARLLVGQIGVRDDFRVLTGRLTADVIAAVARCVDAFVVAGASNDRPGDAMSALAIALSTGGVPVVTNGMEESRVLAHERNAFLIDPNDEHGYVRTLNQVLGLPAVQRHFLGEEFARFTLAKWRWADVASTYADRFAALVGRPQIPADFRAA